MEPGIHPAIFLFLNVSSKTKFYIVQGLFNKLLSNYQQSFLKTVLKFSIQNYISILRNIWYIQNFGMVIIVCSKPLICWCILYITNVVSIGVSSSAKCSFKLNNRYCLKASIWPTLITRMKRVLIDNKYYFIYLIYTSFVETVLSLTSLYPSGVVIARCKMTIRNSDSFTDVNFNPFSFWT